MNTQAHIQSPVPKAGQRIECTSFTAGVKFTRAGQRATVLEARELQDKARYLMVTVAWDDGGKSALLSHMDAWKVLSEE